MSCFATVIHDHFVNVKVIGYPGIVLGPFDPDYAMDMLMNLGRVSTNLVDRRIIGYDWDQPIRAHNTNRVWA